MIVRGPDLMPLLLTAVPSFRDRWEREVRDENVHGEGRLHYVDAGDFARHLIDLWQKGATDEVRAAFEVIERLHVEGDHYVKELATIGYLEGLQNVAGHAGLDVGELRQYLGPESLRWWNGLNAFWLGRAPAVLPSDETVEDF